MNKSNEQEINRSCRQMRTIRSEFKTRETEDKKERIEGYFAVFGDTYDMGDGMSESIDPHAFDDAISDDVRFLTDHETRLVLGRTSAHTGELKSDTHGLWGSVDINPNDVDATNLYARVQRGDVNQCSFGFDILDESAEVRDDGSIHWTIRKVKLYEVSVCTFPAYETTAVAARSKQKEEILKRAAEKWRIGMKERLRGEN